MKCPGQDSRYWKAGAIFEAKCPECDHLVEFFKDDTTRKCPKCEHKFANPKMDFGCASYCQYAKECIGDLPPELLAFSVSPARFEQMLEFPEGSFLYKEWWNGLMESRGHKAEGDDS